jgi:beta-glucosidase/6-phospho-beta-glucosidase/beta-galactosidase
MPADGYARNTHFQTQNSPFRTFWMGGFECTDQLNSSGNRVDLLEVTGHLELINEDYARLSALGMKTVREGIRWSTVEYKPYHYDFSAVLRMMKAGKMNGVQQIWDICHFGFPADLTPLHPHFTPRFVALCKAFVTFYTASFPGELFFVTPVNEVSFLSWLGGEVAGTSPYCQRNGWNVKYALMKAYIAGARAMKEMSDHVRILTTEPLVNMVPVLDPTPDDLLAASLENEQQFQSVDMLCGKICPELGGSMDLLDILGFNYYYNNQWIVGSYQFLGWNDEVNDPRWKELADLLEAAYLRYDKPFLISETSHPKEDRPIWIRMIAAQCAELINRGAPILGVCLYPVIDRPDWDNLHIWHQAGLWDNDFSERHARVLHTESAVALAEGQQLIELTLRSRQMEIEGVSEVPSGYLLA